MDSDLTPYDVVVHLEDGSVEEFSHAFVADINEDGFAILQGDGRFVFNNRFVVFVEMYPADE